MGPKQNGFKRNITINAIIIGGSFLIAILGIYILGRGIVSKSDAIATGRNMITERSQKVNLVGSLGNQTAEADQLKATINRLLPREEELLSLSQHLDGVSRSTNVDVSFSFRSTPQAPTETSPGYIDINLTVRGELESINNFISILEFRSTRYFIEIAGVSITRTDPDYQADIGGRVFFAPDTSLVNE